jgi:hypothetical protein
LSKYTKLLSKALLTVTDGRFYKRLLSLSKYTNRRSNVPMEALDGRFDKWLLWFDKLTNRLSKYINRHSLEPV